MKVIGFTGTQAGLTDPQAGALALALARFKMNGADRLLIGCCIGADEEAAWLTRALGLRLIGFPACPEGHPKRSARTSPEITFAVAAPLDRNRRIARASDVLIACPRQPRMIQRSGTWATVRYALQAGTRLLIILPDGTITDRIPE